MTLESKIEEAKKYYIEKYGTLDWRYKDEGCVYAIMDYLSSNETFTKKDWEYGENEGITELMKSLENSDEE